jgi:hypothetical protein
VKFFELLATPRVSHRDGGLPFTAHRASSGHRSERSVTPNVPVASENDASRSAEHNRHHRRKSLTKPQHSNDSPNILPETIKIPWELDRQLKIGDGYDALAYRQRKLALKSSSTDEVTEVTDAQPFSFKCIQSSRELFQDKDLLGTVKLDVANFGGLGFSRSSSRTSATSDSTVMVYCTARATTSVLLKHPQPELHEKARALLKDNPKTFHDTYGDYFVRELERSYGFVALVTLQ